MSTSNIDVRAVHATAVSLSDDSLSVSLSDGREITVPIVWFPRLSHGTAAERNNWRLIGQGEGIHWPDLDEDISVESLLSGRKSDESPDSLRRWMESRKHGNP